MDNTSWATQSDYDFDRHARQSDKAYNELLRSEKLRQGGAEPGCWEKFDCGQYLTTFFHMIWQHIKLACWMTVGLGIVMLLFKSQSKKEGVSKHPILGVLQILVAPLAAVALGVLIFGSYLHDEHRAIFNLGLLAIYLVWLHINVWWVVGNDYQKNPNVIVRRIVTMEDVWGPDYEKTPQIQEAARPWLNSYRKTRFEKEQSEKDIYDLGMYRSAGCSRYVYGDDEMADLPAYYTSTEQKKLEYAVMAPWLLAAALVLAFIPWHGAAETVCAHGCSLAEADSIAESTPISKGTIGPHDLEGKATVIVGKFAGGWNLDCSMGYGNPADGTYTVSRVNDNRLPDKDGNYLEFPPNSFLERGVEYKRIICRDWHGEEDGHNKFVRDKAEGKTRAANTPAPPGLIAINGLHGYVTIVAGYWAGGEAVKCGGTYAPPDGTYRATRLESEYSSGAVPDASGRWLVLEGSWTTSAGESFTSSFGTCRDWRYNEGGTLVPGASQFRGGRMSSQQRVLEFQ